MRLLLAVDGILLFLRTLVFSPFTNVSLFFRSVFTVIHFITTEYALWFRSDANIVGVVPRRA